MKSKQKQALNIIRDFLINKNKSPSIRDIQKTMEYKSPYSITVILEELTNEGYIRRTPNGDLQIIKHSKDPNESAPTINVPLVGDIACGTPILAEENIESYFPVSTQVARTPYKYFFLRARGDSMNKRNINDGDIVLVKQQETAEKGDNVVALINDEATIKEFIPQGDCVILKPHSNNPEHQPIVLNEEFRIQGVVVRSFSGIY